MLSHIRFQFTDSSSGQPVPAGLRVIVRSAVSDTLLRLYSGPNGGLISLYGQTQTITDGYADFYVQQNTPVNMRVIDESGSTVSVASAVNAGVVSTSSDISGSATTALNNMRSGTAAIGTFSAAQVASGAQWAAGTTSTNGVVLGDGSIDGGVINVTSDVTITLANAATYNAKLLVLDAAHTITISGDIPNFTALVRPPASGNATIAVTSSATVNGGTTSITKSLADTQVFGVMWFAANCYLAQ